MEKDLGSKKINNEEKVNEGSVSENATENYKNAPEIIHPEVEKDKNGNAQIVQRVRTSPDKLKQPKAIETEKDLKKTIENKDRNSDITSNRYPNSHPDNHKNRGNIEMDE